MDQKEQDKLGSFAIAMKAELQKAGVEAGTSVLETALKNSWEKMQSKMDASCTSCENGMRW